MTAVTITAGHIARGFARDCYLCPVALAIRDAFPEANYVSVAGSVYMAFGGSGIEHELPREAQQFAWDFDTGQPVEPFTFDLDYPAEHTWHGNCPIGAPCRGTL